MDRLLFAVASVDSQFLWSIPLLIALSGIFWWATRRSALRPLASRIGRLASSATRARDNARTLADAHRQAQQGLSGVARRVEDASGDAADMSSLARQTAGAADEAAAVARTSRATAERCAGVLSDIISSMELTRRELAEAGALARSVDEMAVQTNLLALNAAIEASRGGTAGELLAHMAEELHDIAIRSAEAARLADQILARALTRNTAGEREATGLRSAMVELEAGGVRIARLTSEIADAEREKATELSLLSQSLAESQKSLDAVALAEGEAARLADEIAVQTGRAASLSREIMETSGRDAEAEGSLESPQITIIAPAA